MDALKDDLEIWWIRHGESEWNHQERWQGHTDIPLSKLGERQAVRLRDRLREERFEACYSSDLERARRTCEIALPGQQVKLDTRLREVHYGYLEGLRRDELSPEQVTFLRQWLHDPYGSRIPEGGESLQEVSQRVDAWFQELPASGKVAAFAHGGLIRCVLWNIVGPPRQNAWTLQLANSSLTIVRYGRRTSIECINDCGHLRHLDTEPSDPLS